MIPPLGSKSFTHPFKIQLTLSGHTMECNLVLKYRVDKMESVKWRYKHWAGIYEDKKQLLNVNRGFGYLAYPGRVGIWPEVSVITLSKTKSRI